LSSNGFFRHNIQWPNYLQITVIHTLQISFSSVD
jgi:hypothetical protein